MTDIFMDDEMKIVDELEMSIIGYIIIMMN